MMTAKQALLGAIEKLDRKIDGPDGLDAIVAEAATMVALGQRPQADLDQAIKERDAAVASRAAAHAALRAQAAADAQQQAEQIEGERLAAVKLASRLLADRAKVAGKIQEAINALADALLEHSDLSAKAGTAIFNAGFRDQNRSHQLDDRAIAGYFADRLTRSGAAVHLAPFTTVGGVQHFEPGTTLVDVTERRNAALLARIGGAK